MPWITVVDTTAISETEEAKLIMMMKDTNFELKDNIFTWTHLFWLYWILIAEITKLSSDFILKKIKALLNSVRDNCETVWTHMFSLYWIANVTKVSVDFILKKFKALLNSLRDDCVSVGTIL